MISRKICKLQIAPRKWHCRINDFLIYCSLFLIFACDQSDVVIDPDIDSFDQALIISYETVDFETIESSPFLASRINSDNRVLLSLKQKITSTSDSIAALIDGIQLVKDTLYLDYGQLVNMGSLLLDRHRITDTVINSELVNYTRFDVAFNGLRTNLPLGFSDIFFNAKNTLFTNNSSSKRLDPFTITLKPVSAIHINNIEAGRIIGTNENLVVRFNRTFNASKTIFGVQYESYNMVIRASQSRDFILIKSDILNEFRNLVNQISFNAILWVMESDVSIATLNVNEKGSLEIFSTQIMMQSINSIEIVL